MNSKDIQFISEAYCEMYDANRGEQFQREEIELILNYLLDEGYVDSFYNAELIFENMSENWKYKIIEDFKPLTSKKEGRVKERLGDLAREVQELGANYNELGREPLAKFRPGIKKRRQKIANTIRKKARLSQNAADALTNTSISRSANIEFRRQELLKKLKDLEY